jgi:hypothetical protein
MSHNVYFFRDITVWCGCTLFENDIFSPAVLCEWVCASVLGSETVLCILNKEKTLGNTCTSFATLPLGTAVLCVNTEKNY